MGHREPALIPRHPTLFARRTVRRDERLRSLRVAHGMSFAQLAAASGVNAMTCCALETKNESPLLADGITWRSAAVRLAEFYGLLPDELWLRLHKRRSRAIARLALWSAEPEERWCLLHPDAPGGCSPEDAFLYAESRRLVRVEVGRLREVRRLVILQRFWEDLTLENSGSGQTRERVRQIEAAAIRELRDRLEIRAFYGDL